jgi:hypothetical protein
VVGPRNISTAMMRSWGNRADTVVVDEPLYAFYLQATGKKHPVAKEVIAAGETDWRKVVAKLTTDVLPSGHKGPSHIFYQKLMTHHLLPEVERDWLASLTNCFLIRDPAEVIASYIKKNDDPELQDLGFVQQTEIFEWVRERSETIPPVIDAGMSCRIPNGCCAFCVARLGSSLIPRCSVGRLACARRTAFGRNTGTERWQIRPGSHLIASGRRRYRSDYAGSKRVAGNLTTSFSNTACGRSDGSSGLGSACDAHAGCGNSPQRPF